MTKRLMRWSADTELILFITHFIRPPGSIPGAGWVWHNQRKYHKNRIVIYPCHISMEMGQFTRIPMSIVNESCRVLGRTLNFPANMSQENIIKWEIFSESCWTKPKSNCIYAFAFVLQPYGIQFGSKSIEKWWIQSDFGLD